MTDIKTNGRGNRWSWLIWGGAGALLLTPLIAMQFTDEVQWDVADFAFIGALLAIACGIYEVAARMQGNGFYKGATAVAVVASFLLIWVNLAVGILGEPDNPANLMFGGVLLVAVVGSVVVWFRAAGMAWVMAATAAAQIAVAIVALGQGYPDVPLTGIWIVMWLVSAGLFALGARQKAH